MSTSVQSLNGTKRHNFFLKLHQTEVNNTTNLTKQKSYTLVQLSVFFSGSMKFTPQTNKKNYKTVTCTTHD